MQEIGNQAKHGLEGIPVFTHRGSPTGGRLPIALQRGAPRRTQQFRKDRALARAQHPRVGGQPFAEVSATEGDAFRDTFAHFGSLVIKEPKQCIQFLRCGRLRFRRKAQKESKRCEGKDGARYWVRTSDPLRVREVLYH